MSTKGGAELIVPYDPEQRALYESGDSRSIFYCEPYPKELWRGIYRHGRFPEIAVRASFRALGFSVFISDPRMPNDEGFILTHYAGKRQQAHPAFTRMFAHFPQARIEDLNRQCDAAKIDVGRNRSGGDPDLFVFCNSGDRFFVEVKDRDQLRPKQLATFLKIKEILGCEVRIAESERCLARDLVTFGLLLAPRPAHNAAPANGLLGGVSELPAL